MTRLPLSQQQKAQQFRQAVTLSQQGRLGEAQSICQAILRVQPPYFDALHLLGFLNYQQGRNSEALDCLTAALKLNPAHTEVRSDLGHIQAKLGRLADALASFDAVLELNPKHVRALNGRGNALMGLKCFTDALASYDAAIAIAPGYVEALNNRGNALTKLKRPAEAVASYDAVLTLAPRLPDVLNNRGNALRDLKYLDEALASFDQALALKPDYAEALSNRGNVLADLKHYAEALASFDQALTVNPKHVDALNNRGNALKELGRHDEALASCDAALALKPDYAEAYNNKGLVYNELGQMEAARQAIEKAIAFAPRNAGFYHYLARCKRLSAEDPHLKAMEDLAQDVDSLSVDDQVSLHFGLGQTYSNLADTGAAFRHWLKGNALRRKQTPYNEAVKLGLLERTRTAFTADVLRGQADAGDPSSIPVFILGMPRSGTTLVEQILASHPAVFGAGEIEDFHAAMIACSRTNPYSPEALSRLSGEELGRLGMDYIERIRAAAPTAGRITNKTPENFWFIGSIAMALPNARIIHTRRDPVDICLSCFSTLFAGDNLPYTYDLAELGRFYRAYDAMMTHWRAVLPPGVMLEVQYEEVVADLEGQARRILEHCDLEWDSRCLDFHKTKRPVRTASMAQVRQPIYKGSVGRWHAYEPFLGPLLAELGLKP